MSIDHIQEVNKNVDKIEHVEKFNPFHDARGRFSSSRGMASYSANPNTKAGRMAIDRSTAAGYGAVMNVHRESKGENIRQNDLWIKNGQKPTASQLARAQANAPKTVSQARQNAHTNRVKGTMGATETAQARNPKATPKQTTTANQQTQQNNQQNANQTPQNQQTQANQNGGWKANAANVTVSASQKIGIQPRTSYGATTQSQKLSKDNDQVHIKGKDISKTFDATSSGSTERAVDQVKKAQGWDKGATVTNDLDLFQKAAVASGQLLFRSVHDEGNMTAKQVCDITMNDGKATLGGSGLKAYGGGMYLVGAQTNNTTGKSLGQQIAASQRHSFSYGPTQMMATVHPSANIATPRASVKMQKEFYKLGHSERAKFGHDVGAYIASKGYDGAQWHNRSDPYITMYNKSAMIFYGEVYDK